MIHVCSLARLHDTVRETGARHARPIQTRYAVRTAGVTTMIPTPSGIAQVSQ